MNSGKNIATVVLCLLVAALAISQGMLASRVGALESHTCDCPKR